MEPSQLDAKGKQAFAIKNFDEAADYFRQAADGYSLGRAGLSAAESRNNLSVALLQAGKAQEALDAALGTDAVFAGANDHKRHGMALGNQAAALEALNRYDEAIALYDRSAELFDQAGEGDLRAMVKKSSATLQLKTGKVPEAAVKMIGSYDAKENPTFFERIMKFIVRFIK